MNKKTHQSLSKTMSYILRHRPLEFGIILDKEGYCSLEELVQSLCHHEKWGRVKKEDVLDVVKQCEKQRYEVKEGKIRARYGHSIQEIAYEEKTPPISLIHGTSYNTLSSIKEEGILSMNRQYVHLSETPHFAKLAGNRKKGKLCLLEIDTKKAIQQGVRFFHAGEEVWLSTAIPPSCFRTVT
jgi:putative RNA 2'-phosphotransferase